MLVDRLVAGGVLCAALTGCYAYIPLVQPEPVVGSQIATELTNAGTDTLARAVGPGISSLRGRVLANSDSGLVLSIRAVTARNGEETFWKGEVLQIPKISVSRIEQRQFSLGRSLVLAGGAIGAAVFAWKAFAGGQSSRGVPTGPVGGNPR